MKFSPEASGAKFIDILVILTTKDQTRNATKIGNFMCKFSSVISP